jgi:hypothetical protein
MNPLQKPRHARRAGVAAAVAFALSACATVPANQATTPVAAAQTGVAQAPAGSPAQPGTAAPVKPAVAPRATPAGAQAAVAPGAAPAAAAPGTVPPGAAAAMPRPGEPPAPRPFNDVVKDAKESKGFIAVWQKDERTWLEIRPDQFDQPFFFGNSLTSGLGEAYFLPGLMGPEHIVYFKRVGTNVQLLARNLRVRAPEGSPLALAIRESHSDSLLGVAPVASAPHPERKSILVDASTMFLGDLVGAQTALETVYRMPFALDRANSSIERVRVTDGGTFIGVRSHFAVPKLPAPPAVPPPPGAQLPKPPRIVPDPRSLFLGFAYTLAPLPKEPMRPRLADPRVGHFTTAFRNFGTELGLDGHTHFVERWRLEKKDPNADVSEPKDPIRVVMDRNIPEKHRPAIRAGILEWNKAFERAGFRNAITVEQQPADADWLSTEGLRILAVRWFAMKGPGAVAVGPSQADPRSGEILRGAAIIPENWVRIGRSAIGESYPKPSAASSLGDLLGADRVCTYAYDALEQANFGFELLAERGVIDPTGPDADRYIADSLKDVTMHEVGHALGLRHNFKASTGVKLEQLRDAAYVRARGTSNSVMDYNALNLPLEKEPASVYQMVTLGEYDYWAIEYAYRELPAATEAAELKKIVARSANNPALAYATDEDQIASLDPTANIFDLSSEPLEHYKRRFLLARELWSRTQKRELKSDESYAIYRRNLTRGLGQIGFVTPLIAKYVGGAVTTRDTPGLDRPLFAPVPAGTQRQALDLLSKEVFAADSFRFDPRFMSRLGVEQLDRFVPTEGQFIVGTDFSLATVVLAIQRTALDTLMSDAMAIRLADAETKVADRRQLLTLADVHGTLSGAIWSELKSGRDIDSLRRNLQREHVRRLATGLVRPTSLVANDVRAVHRATALQLEADLKRALASGKVSPMTRAHLTESLTTLSEALKAPLLKQGV